MKGYPNFFPIVLAACFINHAFAFAFPLLILILVNGSGLSEVVAPSLVAVAFFFSAVVQPTIGRWLDRGYYQLPLLLSCLFGGFGILGLLLFTKAPTIVLLAITSVFVMGVTTLSTFTSRLLEGGVTPEQRPTASSLTFAAMNLGFGVSALLAFLYIKNHRSTLLSLDILTLLFYGIVLFWAFTGIIRVPKKQSGRAGVTLPKEHRGIFIGSLLLFLPTVSLLSAIPLLYKRMGLPAEQMTALTFGVNNVLIVILGIWLAKFIDYFSPCQRLWIAGSTQALGHALIPVAQTAPAVAGVTLLWSVGEAFVYPVMTQTIFACFSANEVGLAAGVKSFLMRVAFVIVPLISVALSFLPFQWYSLTFCLAPLAGIVLLQRAVK